MNKKYLTGIILATLLISFTFAVVLSTTDRTTEFDTEREARDYLSEYKTERESIIGTFTNTIMITSDKKCPIDIETEIASCFVCYIYTVGNVTYDDCMGLPLNITLQEDLDLIETHALDGFNEIYPLETIIYIERVMKGLNITIR